MTSTIHLRPVGNADKKVRFKLSCGHQRAMAAGTLRLSIRSKQKLFEHYRERHIWCYLCSEYREPVRLMGVEVVK